ncbi:MAG: CDP-archaeol synthase [Nanoarchaeota archaeon]
MVFLLLLQSLYFFLPAYFANMSPVLLRFLPGGIPIHERWFGPNKTWRGLIVAPLVAGLIFFLQKLLYNTGYNVFTQLAIIDYADFSLALGFLQGAGAILGDLVKSYYKRKEGLKPSQRWLPWDQLDFMLGGIVGSFFVYVPPVEVVVMLLVVSPFLHIAVNHLGYWLKIREKAW